MTTNKTNTDGRVIKFRAWDVDNHEMRYSDRDEDNGEGIIVWQLNSYGVSFEEPQLIDRMPGGVYHEQSVEYRAPKQVVMQFTGLKDKNGVEIYEGDVLEFGYVDSDLATLRQKGEVFWHQGWMAWGLRSTMLNIPFWDKTGHDGLADFIVLGNIYENPELLDKEAEEL